MELIDDLVQNYPQMPGVIRHKVIDGFFEFLAPKKSAKKYHSVCYFNEQEEEERRRKWPADSVQKEALLNALQVEINEERKERLADIIERLDNLSGNSTR